MNQPIVSSLSPITLIGGVKPAPATLTKALSVAPCVVAVDGGGDHALAAGLMPEAVIGDMDSLSDAGKQALDGRVHHIAEQNSTDFDKALRSIAAPLVIGVGFLGDRLDHALAALHVLLKYRDTPVVLLGEHDLLFIAPSHIQMTLPTGMRFSLMPITDARVDASGLKYTIKDGAMSMRDFIGSSNEVAQPLVDIRAMGGLAVILPPEALDAALTGLTAAFRAG